MFSSSLSGDFGKLTAFGNRVGGLGEPAVFRDIARAVGQEGLDQVDKGFADQRDPYGIPWYRKRYPDGRNVLQGASGKLRKSFAITYVGAEAVTFGSNLARSVFAQRGTGLYGPKRSLIRAKGRAFPIATPGGTIFRRSSKGQQQRRMVPVKSVSSAPWNRAFSKRIRETFGAKLRKV
jgi:hypothetical protein